MCSSLRDVCLSKLRAKAFADYKYCPVLPAVHMPADNQRAFLYFS